MSWDVILVKTHANKEPMDEITADNVIPFKKEDTIQKFKSTLPDLDCSDDTWLVYENDGDSFEINLATEEQVMLHINELKEPTGFLKKMCLVFNCRAFDTTNGEFI